MTRDEQLAIEERNMASFGTEDIREGINQGEDPFPDELPEDTEPTPAETDEIWVDRDNYRTIMDIPPINLSDINVDANSANSHAIRQMADEFARQTDQMIFDRLANNPTEAITDNNINTINTIADLRGFTDPFRNDNGDEN